MKAFFGFLGRVKDTGSWLSKSVLALPVIALLADVVPPWPSKTAVTGLTSIAELMLLMYAYEAWRTRSKPALLKRMRRFGLAAAVMLLVYLAGIAFFTHVHPEREERGRFAIGFTYAPHAEKLLEHFAWDLDHALEATGFNPARIWTASSIQTVQVGLLAAWLGFFGCVTVYVGAFVARKRR